MIKVIGDITEEAYQLFSDALDSETARIVDIELCSGGGSAEVALAFAAKMRMSKKKIRVTVYGQVASAAILILAYADVRRMTHEAWAMVHEDSAKLSGNVVDLERESKHLRDMETQWARLLFSKTKTDTSVWTKLHKQTTYMSPEMCSDFGLIDEII